MIQKLRKRRPSESNQRPAELSVRIPNSTYALFHLDSATSRTTGVPASTAPLAGLPELSTNQGDFRGSIIIDSLSKRFSVLRAKASPVRPTFPNLNDIPEPYTPQSAGLDEIRQRLAAQRQRARGTGRYVAEEEENLVLEELALPEDDYAHFVSPMGFPTSTSDRFVGYRPLIEHGRHGSSRTYGFGATSGMKEAEVMMRAHTGKRSVSDKSVASDVSKSRSETPLSGHRNEELGQGPFGNGKRKSLLAMLPVETQERITNALLEIEEDLQAEAMEAEMVSEPQPSETLIADGEREVSGQLQKSSQPMTPQHKRQNSSITRSPFRENLAQIAKGIDVEESGSRTHSRTHSRAASSISIAQPDFTAKPIPKASSTTSSRHSSRRGHSRGGSSVDLNRFRFGSGLSERVEDIANVFSLPPPAPAPTAALPPIPTPLTSHDDLPEQEIVYKQDDINQNQANKHQRTPSASASPIPMASFETGYIPGSARPFAAPKSDSPLELVSNHDFGNIAPVGNSNRAIAPPLVRKGSKLIPPNRPGPLMLQPTVTPRSVTASSLPSVSPVVETFADSAKRKGYTEPGPYNDNVTTSNTEQGLHIAHAASPRGVDIPVGPGPHIGSPLDVSFDIDGYYGAGRSPVEPMTRYPSQRQAPRQADELLRPPSPPRQQQAQQDRNLRTRPSLETLRSTFTENSTDLPSPALYTFPNLISKRVESGSTTPLTDVFGSDIDGDGDDGKQELFDELEAMQERLLEAAREVRRGLNAGAQVGDGKRKDVAPRLRTRPSIRARKPEPSMYPDMGENVSQLVRAMSPRQPSESSFRRQPSPSPHLHQCEDTPLGSSPHSALGSTHVTVPPRVSPTPLTPDITPRGDLGSFETVQKLTPNWSPGHTMAQTSSGSSVSPNIDNRSKLLGSPISTGQSREGAFLGGQERMAYSVNAGSRNAKANSPDEIERRRDFEARIAHATAQLQKTPSTNVKRRPSTKDGAAINIGSPTLINSSAKINVTPLPISNTTYGLKEDSPPVGFSRHTRHQSSSAINGENSNSGRGLKAFVAKIKRNASLAERKRSKTPGSSPRVPETRFQTLASLAPMAKSTEEVSIDKSTISTPVAIQQPFAGTPISPHHTRQAPQTKADHSVSRKSVVRRTIIFSTPNNQNGVEANQDVEAMPASASSPSRRPSTRRKPVRHLSGDTDLLRAEGLIAGPESQSISQVMSSSQARDPSPRRQSGTDSLYDIYADIANQDEEHDQEEVIYTGARSSFSDNTRPQFPGLSRSTKPRAIEIREMSDGQTTWSLVDVNDPLLRGIEPRSDPLPAPRLRNDSLTSSLSSYGGNSQLSRGSGIETGQAEIVPGRSGEVRPKTNIFYSHESDVAELIDDLSRNGFEGKFRIVSPTADQSQSQSQSQPTPQSRNQNAELSSGISTIGGMEKRLQALMQRMLATPNSPST